MTHIGGSRRQTEGVDRNNWKRKPKTVSGGKGKSLVAHALPGSTKTYVCYVFRLPESGATHHIKWLVAPLVGSRMGSLCDGLCSVLSLRCHLLPVPEY